jgi:WD40 repeat protein
MRKLLGQPTSTTTESIDTSTIESPQLRPSASQNTVYSAGAPITCLDRSSDGQRAVIAGAKVFRILRVDGPTITEDIDLRSTICSYSTSHDLSTATADQLNIKAVTWSHGVLNSTIITACGNGRITLYDLNRVGEGLEVARIQAHPRQVHKLAISPFKGNWLLSASQDGTVKSFDLRTPFNGRNGPTFRASQTFKVNADAVRDVKWSPTDGMEFACSTDAGMVQKWDIRKPGAPTLKFTAHQSSCFSISWHPDGEHLISGGLDQHCHVWDVSKRAERGQKPRYSFATPAPVYTVSWRPACWSSTAQAKRAAQVIIAYDDSNPTRYQTSTVHLWDVARPTMPFREIEHWDSSPTGLLWNSRDLLWSVDRDGHFTQTDVAFAPRVLDHRSLSTFTFSPNGDVLMLLEERQAPRRPRPSINSPEIPPTYQHNSNGSLLSVSRSDSEEDVVGSFLGPRQRRHRRRHSGRSTQPLSTTPPTITSMTDNKVMSLDDAVKVTGLYKPQQVMAVGHAPSTAKRAIYKYFSTQYLERMAKDASNTPQQQPTNVRMAATMEHFARAAENARHYRLAQTWRILGYTMNLLLTRRAEHHRQARLTLSKPNPKDYALKVETKDAKLRPDRGEDTPRKVSRAHSPLQSPTKPATKPIVGGEIESTSNVATPLVRPVRDAIVQETREAIQTPLIVEDDVLELPEAAHSTSPGPIPVPGSYHLSDHTGSSVEGYDFYGIESFTPAIDFAAPPRKHPLRLDYAQHNGPSHRIQLQRHDSGESFQMFSTSGDSQRGKFMSSSENDNHSLENDDSRSLRDRVSSWERPFNLNSRHRPSVDSDAPARSESSDDHPTPNSNEVGRGVRNGLPQDPAEPPLFRLQEASVPSGGQTGVAKKIKEVLLSPSLCEKASNDTNPNIIESDFLPWPSDPEFTIPPIDPTVLIQRSITFETQTGALNASAMVLLLHPFLPPNALDEIQAEAILRQYHHRLTSMKLFTEAALLRNLCVPLYPSIFAIAQKKITIGYFCTDCHKPFDPDPLIPNSVWRCPRCQQAMAACAVCKHRELDPDLYDKEDVALESVIWWSCPGCGHGGHTACMQAWHAGPEFEEGSNHSGGSCPLEGCLHPCLPGTWRDKRAEEKKAAKQKELEFLVKENTRQGSGRGTPRGVRRDAREVNQSKAVEGVRVALGVTSLAQSGGLERKKSVKLVAPGEEG